MKFGRENLFMSKNKKDHTIIFDDEYFPCTKNTFDATLEDRPLEVRYEFMDGNDDVPKSVRFETDAVWFAIVEALRDVEKPKKREKDGRQKSLEDLTDHNPNLQDLMVNVAADAVLSAEITEFRRKIAKLPDEDRDLLQRTKFDKLPMTVEDYAKMKGVTENAVWQQMKRIKAKIKKMK